VEEISEEPVQVVARVCAIDIGKADLVACAGAAREPPGSAGAGGPRVRDADAGRAIR
jgi:hypothetical protein